MKNISKLFIFTILSSFSGVYLYGMSASQINTMFTLYVDNAGYINNDSIGKVTITPFQQGEGLIDGSSWASGLDTNISTYLNYLYNQDYQFDPSAPQLNTTTQKYETRASTRAAFAQTFPGFNIASFMYAALYSFSDDFGDTEHKYAYNFRMANGIGSYVEANNSYLTNYVVNASAFTTLTNAIAAFFAIYSTLPA